MQVPKIEFSSWFKWKERNTIENSDKPGVYMLSKFKTTPHGVDPLDENVIYFGETCKSLKQRWNQFDASAFQQKRGHSGGKTYRNIYRGDKGLDLYVAAMPVLIENNDLRSSFIRFAERKLIFDFVMRCKRLPRCNSK